MYFPQNRHFGRTAAGVLEGGQIAIIVYCLVIAECLDIIHRLNMCNAVIYPLIVRLVNRQSDGRSAQGRHVLYNIVACLYVDSGMAKNEKKRLSSIKGAHML
jgi:hypothetical protein